MGLCGSAAQVEAPEASQPSKKAKGLEPAFSQPGGPNPAHAKAQPATTTPAAQKPTASSAPPEKPAASPVPVTAPSADSANPVRDSPAQQPQSQPQTAPPAKRPIRVIGRRISEVDTAVFVRDMTEAFNVMAEKQGYIVAMELRELLPTLQPDITREEMDALVKEADPTSHGKIFLDPFLRMMINYRQIQSAPAEMKNEVLESFKVLDPENKGFVPTSELKELMPVLNENLTEEEIDAMLKQADPDGTGKVFRPSFVRMMTDPKIPR